ncbi:hypothetical protein Y032_0094g2777 [Ancylostoma ceylanicum]|nr:hypothetical protein Y032_0094g2777 [Ancylostoma ceylanicum]
MDCTVDSFRQCVYRNSGGADTEARSAIGQTARLGSIQCLCKEEPLNLIEKAASINNQFKSRPRRITQCQWRRFHGRRTTETIVRDRQNRYWKRQSRLLLPRTGAPQHPRGRAMWMLGVAPFQSAEVAIMIDVPGTWERQS